MWEYVKGSEADFEGAPQEATIKAKNIYFGGFSFLQNNETGSLRWDVGINGGCIRTHVGNKDNWQVIAERRKVDDLQSRTNDVSLQQTFDNVQCPAHYNQSGIECIDAIAAAVKGKNGIEAVLVGNVIKYLWRYELKNGVEDVRKAQWYLDRLVKELSK